MDEVQKQEADMSQGENGQHWNIIFEGSGSVTGNSWLEEVCYIGKEQWLLRLRDDPAWSMGVIVADKPDEHTSESIASWVIEMDLTDRNSDLPRVNALREIAAREGAAECELMLQRILPL